MTRKTYLKLNDCIDICDLYYGREREAGKTYLRGPQSIRQLGFLFEVSHDTIKRVLRGQYKINDDLFNPATHGYELKAGPKCKSK